MMYKCQKEQKGKLILLAFSLEICNLGKVLFSNKNASADSAEFSQDVNKLCDKKWINFDIVFSESWTKIG